jgi:hypothetical protein
MVATAPRSGVYHVEMVTFRNFVALLLDAVPPP